MRTGKEDFQNVHINEITQRFASRLLPTQQKQEQNGRICIKLQGAPA
jgi:hypothetical protein